MRQAVIAITLLAAACSAGGDDDLVATGAPIPSETTRTPAPLPGSASTLAPTSASSTSPPADPGGVVPTGFGQTTARITKPDGTTCDVCMWLADTARQRARGLMSVTDLGAADAMAFRYPDPHTGTFWMKDTILPLSIAFYAPDGAYLEAFDMEPCTTSTCPNYATPADFLVAVEVPRGGLADLGLLPGSRLDLLDLPCE